MAHKKFIKIPKIVAITCRNCGKRCRRAVKIDDCPQYFDCDACGQRMQTPVSACCIICAFTNKKCPASLVMESKIKKLEIRY